MRDSLVFSARRPPFPLDSGAPIRTHRLLTGLARSFETTFVTFEHDPRSPDGHTSKAELEQLLPGIRIVTVPGLGPGKRATQVLSLVSPASWTFGRYRVPAFRESLRATVAEREAAIIHFDDPGAAHSGPVENVVNAFAPHNVEHRIVEGTARSSRGGRRFFARVEARKLAREERRMWSSMAVCIAVSDVDAEAMRAGGARKVVVIPNGADPVERLPPPVRERGDPLHVLFVGAGVYQPNEHGIRWFIEEVFPRVSESVPAVFDVVGAPPRRPVSAPGVAYHGSVPSVAPFYERAHVAVVPLFYGSGTRLKALEALAYGRPLVSTSFGVEGLPIEDGVHYVRADDAGAFADALVSVAGECSGDGSRLRPMLDHAREAVTPFFWPRIADRLAEVYRAEAEQRSEAARWDGDAAQRATLPGRHRVHH